MSKHSGTRIKRLTREQRENIARNIHELRKARFPQDDGKRLCALDMKVDPNQYAPWESGSRTPIHKNLLMIAAYFGVTFDQLCNSSPHDSTDGSGMVVAPQMADVDALQGVSVQKGQKTRKKKSSDIALDVRSNSNKAESEHSKVKIMDLPIPAGALNTKSMRLKYKGEMSIVGIEYLFEE